MIEATYNSLPNNIKKIISLPQQNIAKTQNCVKQYNYIFKFMQCVSIFQLFNIISHKLTQLYKCLSDIICKNIFDLNNTL